MSDDLFRILVPLDGSPEAECVFPTLSPLLHARTARVILFRVAESNESPVAAESYLSDVQKFLAKEGIQAEVKTSWGRAPVEILWQAHPSRCDLIAMTTHGRTGWRRLLLGSVAEAVLRQAEVPLLVNRPGMRVGNWRRLVVALDGSPLAEGILPEATRMARLFGADLHLLKVVGPSILVGGAGEGVAPLPPEDPMPYLRSVAARPGFQGIRTVLVSREGPAGFEIARYAEEEKAGTVCVMTHGRSGLGRLLMGSTTEDLFRLAPCAVFVRRAEKAAVPEKPVETIATSF